MLVEIITDKFLVPRRGFRFRDQDPGMSETFRNFCKHLLIYGACTNPMKVFPFNDELKPLFGENEMVTESGKAWMITIEGKTFFESEAFQTWLADYLKARQTIRDLKAKSLEKIDLEVKQLTALIKPNERSPVRPTY